MFSILPFFFIIIGPILWITFAIVVVYLIAKRIEAREKEDFEKRDN